MMRSTGRVSKRWGDEEGGQTEVMGSAGGSVNDGEMRREVTQVMRSARRVGKGCGAEDGGQTGDAECWVSK